VVIGVEEISDEEFKGYSTREGMVTPLRTKERLDQRFMVGYGYGGVEGKVLVFNPAETELRIRATTQIELTNEKKRAMRATGRIGVLGSRRVAPV
jgi:hypothetical protein